jgi:DNA-binding CsgD family transcriptional regulator
MAATTESQANTESDVNQLLEQFLAGIVDEIAIKEAPEAEPVGELLLGVVELAGVRFKLTCQLCQDEPEAYLSLSPREQEIIRLVMKGLSTRGIAGVLEISPWTVTTHLRRVFSKLGVNSRAEMVACVLKRRIL